MAAYRVLLSPRWLVGHVLALVLVLSFTSFGAWQLRRHLQRQSYNALLGRRLEADPQSFDSLRRRYDANLPAEQEESLAYRRAEVVGWFDTANEVLQRSRARDGQPGYHVLTPLMLDDSQAILVDRGWVPFEMDSPPIAPATPIDQAVRLEGILFPSQQQPQGIGARDPQEGRLERVFWVDTERLNRQLPYRLEPVFLQLSRQSPAQPSRLPIPPLPPELDAGPHLGYAWQWFSFALIGLVGYPLLLRSMLRGEDAAPASAPQGNSKDSAKAAAPSASATPDTASSTTPAPPPAAAPPPANTAASTSQPVSSAPTPVPATEEASADKAAPDSAASAPNTEPDTVPDTTSHAALESETAAESDAPDAAQAEQDEEAKRLSAATKPEDAPDTAQQSEAAAETESDEPSEPA